jgi:hypothetical protein
MKMGGIPQTVQIPQSVLVALLATTQTIIAHRLRPRPDEK